MFIILLFNLKNSLYIWDRSFFSDIWIANIFPQLVLCLFILLTVLFTEQKSLILMEFILSIFSFMHFTFDVSKVITKPKILCVLLEICFFLILHLDLWPILSYFLCEVSRFIFLHVEVWLFQHHLLQRLSFLSWTTTVLLSKLNWLYLCRSIFGISILFHWSLSLFSPVHTVFSTVTV